MARKKNLDFESTLEELETIVEDMENGGLSLEASLKAFEKGIVLTRECQEALNQAEQKVKVLMATNDNTRESEGDENWQDFNPEKQ